MSNNHTNLKKSQSIEQFEKIVEEYKLLLRDKTLPANQTVAYKKNEVSIIERLIVAADELDEYSPGQGLVGLIILDLRTTLRIKERVAEMEAEIRELKREIKRLSKR